MSYWLWGVPEGKGDIVIVIGIEKKGIEHVFDQVELAAEVELEHVNPWETPFLVFLSRSPAIPLADIWAKNRPW